MNRQVVPSAPARPLRRSPRRPRLLTLGDLVLDVVARPDRPLSVGTDVSGRIELRAGGSAANTARAFAAAGGEASFLGAVGADATGRRLVRALRADGVRVHAAEVGQPTGRLAVLVDPRGERSFVTQRGAADLLGRHDVRAALVTRADALHVPAYSLINEPLRAAATLAVERAHAADRLVSIDLASRGPLLAQGRAAARRLIADAQPDILFANADEASALVGSDVQRLLGLAPIAIVKEGAAGCRVLWRSNGAGPAGEGTSSRSGTDVLQVAVATAPIRAADSTGAGDAFDAGFLHALLTHWLTLARRAAGPEPAADGATGAAALARTAPFRQAPLLRRAALAGHRSAAALLSRPRPELQL
jgi:sugar/nucleoside kinase (ribokinase family)